MKLECPVVRDLYVLYCENELSPEVREAVEEHLKDCEECRRYYEDGTSISEAIKKDIVEEPSKKLDERMLLKLKVGRLRVGMLILAIVFLMSAFNYYSTTRKNLSNDLSWTYNNIAGLWHNAQKNAYFNYDYTSQELKELNSHNSMIIRDLDFIEEKRLKDEGLYLQDNFLKMLQTLNDKRNAGAMDPRDQRARELLEQYSFEAMELLRVERDKMYTVRDNIFLIPFKHFDSKELAASYKKINELTLTYTNYHRLPDEIKPLSEEELIERIKSAIKDNDAKIQFNAGKFSILPDGSADFFVQTKENKFVMTGSIDAYTGVLRNFENFGNPSSGESITSSEAEKRTTDWLRWLYGDNYEYKLQYKGINYKIGGDVGKNHSFVYTPIIRGYAFYTTGVSFENGSGFTAYIDSTGGNLARIYTPFQSMLHFVNARDNVKLDTTINVSPEEGFKSLQLKDKQKYSFIGTYVITSRIYSKDVLVHVYSSKEAYDSVFVNTVTGKQDFEY